MKSISINNGHSTTTPAKAIKAVGIEVIALMMDDETREHVATQCSLSDASFPVGTCTEIGTPSGVLYILVTDRTADAG